MTPRCSKIARLFKASSYSLMFEVQGDRLSAQASKGRHLYLKYKIKGWLA